MSENDYSKLLSASTEAIVDFSAHCFKGASYYWMLAYDRNNSRRANSYLILFDYGLKNADLQYLYKLTDLITIDKKVSDFYESSD